jgi:hypothetical protein
MAYNYMVHISFWFMLKMLMYWEEAYTLEMKCTYYKENTVSLIVAIQEIGLEVNADKTKYIVMSGDQNAGRSHNMKTDNRSFEIQL